MTTDPVRRVPVWSPMVRLAHWLMAVAVVVLLLTGWLMGIAPALRPAAVDYHYIFGYVLVFALGLRLYLLFLGRGAAHWSDFLPQAGAVGAMLRFYVTLGHSPLPAWYAHNPAWGPVHLALLVLLVVQVSLGLGIDLPYLLAGFTLPVLHLGLAKVIAFIIALHVITAFFHDLKGTGSDVSAMINGHRIFVVRKPQDSAPSDPPAITLEEIRRSRDGRAGERD